MLDNHLPKNAPRRAALTLALLLGAAGSQAAAFPQADSLSQRFAAWKLNAALGVPGAEELAALETLVAEASGAPGENAQLAASMETRAKALRANLTPVAQEKKTAKPQSERAREAAEREVLRLAVEQAVAESDAVFLRTLGKKAVPVLKTAALAWDGAPPPGEQQPALHWLTSVDPTEGLDVALVLMKRPSFLLKRSTLRVLEVTAPFAKNDPWRPEGDTNWRLKNPEWEQILHLALKDPAVEPAALKLHLEHFIRRGQLPRSLAQTAVEVGVGYNVQVVPTDGLWFLNELATSPNEQQRRYAAGFLPYYGDSKKLLPLAQDVSDRVQEQLARKLLSISVRSYVDPSRQSTKDVRTYVEVNDSIVDAFIALSGSPHSNVRSQIEKSLRGLLQQTNESPFNLEQTKRLFAEVTDRGVVRYLATAIPTLPEADRFEALSALIAARAERKEPSVLQTVLNPTEFGLASDEYFFPVLNLLHGAGQFNATTPPSYGERQDVPTLLGLRATSDDVDPEPFLDCAAQWGWIDLLTPCLQSNSKKLRDWTKPLSNDAKLRLVRLVYGRATAQELKSLQPKMLRAIELNFVRSPDLLASLVDDESAPIGAREWAAAAYAKVGTAPFDSARVKTIAKVLVQQGDVEVTNRVLREADESLRAPLTKLIIGSADASADYLMQLRIEDLDAETLDTLWDRAPASAWKNAEVGVQIIWPVVSGLGDRSTESLDPRLAEIDFSNEQAWTAVMNAAARTKSPALLSLVREIVLRPDFVRASGWQFASASIGQYMNAEAAELLLELAQKAPNQEARKHAMEALAQITAWRKAASAWEKSAGATAKRAQAIGDLVKIIDDGAQPTETRAAAIKGLGLLDAVEELPRIIGALKAKEPAIQEAARAALARLEKDD